MEALEDKAKVRVGQLTSVGRVGIEIGRLYRKVRRGELPSAEGMRMVQMLLGLKACLETSDLEQKMEDLNAMMLKITTNVVTFPAKRA